MIPRTLHEWSKEALIELLDKNYFEPESFDFKVKLPDIKDPDGKLRLRKACCAFANTFGGFLVFGIADERRLTSAHRLVGLPPTYDFPARFAPYAGECKPTVSWDYKKPPIRLENGKLVHVVHIPRSWRGPHTVEKGKGEGFIFPKRTNGGDEPMSYEEVRLSFLGYYEKRLKLQLLRSELENIGATAEQLTRPDTTGNTVR
jgi:predicted HTH transcriptional regulator